jgi:rhomboid protease GluP
MCSSGSCGFLKYASKTHAQPSPSNVSQMSFNYGQYGQQKAFLSSPTNLLIVLNVLVFVLMLLSGDIGDCNSLVCGLMAQTGQAVYHGAIWQLFTSMFVHFGFVHIIFNMFGLYYLGRINESRFGMGSYMTIYLASGFLGNVMSLFLLSPATLSGGASGAIFGLVGSYVAIARQARQMGAALMYAVFVFITSLGIGVNIYAHFFGLVAGLVLGLLYSKQRSGGYSAGYSFTVQYSKDQA